ncbi:MAG: unnamed protein product [uncultured Caballeronia sp.]|nr:MAG: unnamed protein product [uncultured Caballeronia sp.]
MALVEEAAAAVQSLDEQAIRLRGTVSVFTVEPGVSGVPYGAADARVFAWA